MKKIKFAILIFLLSNNIYSQTFRYENWSLNEVVTYDDVVSYLGDRTKILEPKYGSSIGQDIKYKDNFNTTTTLCFDENTQILHCIFIDDIIDNAFVNQLRQSIFDQLGKPIYGYEIKEYDYSKNKTGVISRISYRREFLYRKDKYLIHIHIDNNDMTNSETGPYQFIPVYTFAACIQKLPDWDSGIPSKYPSLNNDESGWAITKRELINKW